MTSRATVLTNFVLLALLLGAVCLSLWLHGKAEAEVEKREDVEKKYVKLMGDYRQVVIERDALKHAQRR